MTRSLYYDERYNEESSLLDSWWNFHRHAFDPLTPAERHVLACYYLTGAADVPHDIFAYRHELLRKDPTIEASARKSFRRVATELGLEGKT